VLSGAGFCFPEKFAPLRDSYHLSGTTVTGCLKRPTRGCGASNPVWRQAPDSVYMAFQPTRFTRIGVTNDTVSSYLAFSLLLFGFAQGGARRYTEEKHSSLWHYL